MRAPPGSVLRLTTCGAVDDGKSTLLGRLLLDSDAVFEDHVLALPRTDDGAPDPALLFDGLDAEREQGITIDVAFRYFETAARKYIIADAPGHEAHTRNMATAASQVDLAVIVVDATRGPRPQTLRHIRIAGLVGVRQAILAINKMDAIAWSQSGFEAISAALAPEIADAGLALIATIPVSAKTGAHVVTRSSEAAWYRGQTLRQALDAAEPTITAAIGPFRFPVQSVVKPHALLGGRGYAGTVTSGRIRVGDKVLLPHWGVQVTLVGIFSAHGRQAEAEAGQAVTLVLDGEHDIARGDLIAEPTNPPIMTCRIEADLIGLAADGLEIGKNYELRCATRTASASLSAIEAATRIAANDIARVTLEFARPIPLDPFALARDTGGFLLVDRHSGDTLACGMARALSQSNVQMRPHTITAKDRAALNGHRPAVLWFTGLSGAGKSTIAERVESKLFARGAQCFALDGDNLRSGLCKDLGFSAQARLENLRRAGEVARLFADAGMIVTCAFISPFRNDRALVRDLVGAERFIEVFVDAPLDVCIARDPKGLYKRALAGELAEFSGVSSPYEAPEAPDLRIAAGAGDPEDHAEAVLSVLRARGIIT